MSDSRSAKALVADAPADDDAVEESAAEPKREVSYSNHAIHLMRTAQMSTLKLSQMADQKASILLGATFLVFSLSVSRALTGQMPVSLMILASFSFASSLCAVMAVLPKVGRPDGKITNRNLIFFGHYTWMDEDEWTEQLLERLESDRTVFETMAHDMYQNGQVLAGKKYRFLALAYKVFMFGLFVTLAVFAFEMVTSN
ncbi:Pycsar system effector family protein [Qipengyuania flava]|uniref:Pycsar system effector family protein n=1 Tax=Qipengyuania flava TaxID=192812 RepID=UPI00215ADB88|nr:Pycsar system effector family protein [Qipengyuania flava]